MKEQSYYPSEDNDDDKTDTVGGIIAKTHRLSVSHQDQLEDHKARLEILANAAKLPSKATSLAATKKDITKAIAQSLKQSLPKLSTIHAGHHMYLMRNNPQQVLQQDANNEWSVKGYINKMHRWYTKDDDDDSPTTISSVTYNVSALLFINDS